MKLHSILHGKSRVPTVTVPVELKFSGLLIQWCLKESGDLNDLVFESYPLSTLDAQLGIVNMSDMFDHDAWKVRDEFLACSDSEAIESFLKATGEFAPYGHRFSRTAQWQSLIRALMVASPERWPKLKGDFTENQLDMALLEKFPRVETRWEDGTPLMSFRARNTLHAMVMATQIDYLRGKKFKFCQKSECGTPFEITSRHARMYCSIECASHESVRRYRAKNNSNSA